MHGCEIEQHAVTSSRMAREDVERVALDNDDSSVTQSHRPLHVLLRDLGTIPCPLARPALRLQMSMCVNSAIDLVWPRRDKQRLPNPHASLFVSSLRMLVVRIHSCSALV